MKRVEIITLHRITNFGSLLQTYATQEVVKRLGYDTEVIDYVPDGITFKRGCFPKNNTPLLKKLVKLGPLFVCNLIQYNIVDNFLNRHITTTPKRYGKYSDLISDVPQADIYLSGSDQVWNTQNNNPKNDIKAYYLQFSPKGKKRIAFAGSFGKTEFSDEESKEISNYISQYNAVSVREDTALATLEQHGRKDGVHVLDPTMLLTPQEWQKLFQDRKQPEKGYVFVYNLNRNGLIKEIAKAIADKKGLKIINFADTFDFISGAQNRLFNTPYDFLNYLSNADYVVTDSFHGTAFSINFNKQFITVKAPKYNSRIESILRQTGLVESRFVSSVDQALQTINNDIDYKTVNQIVDEARNKSISFLQKNLSDE